MGIDHKISIIVAVYNNVRQMPNLLESFDRMEGILPVEIVIVDSKSTDGTKEVIDRWAEKSYPFDVKVISMERLGVGAARNNVLNDLKGDIGAFTDADCIVDPRWLERLYGTLVGDPRLVGVGGRVLPAGKDVISKYYGYHDFLNPPAGLEYVVGANCMFWLDKVREVGGFDESCKRYGGEETSMCFALRNKGYELGYNEKAIVYHDYLPSLRDFYRRIYIYGYGGYIVYEKYEQKLAETCKDQKYFDKKAPEYMLPVHRRILHPSRIDQKYFKSELKRLYPLYKKYDPRIRTVLPFLLIRLVHMYAYAKGWQDSESAFNNNKPA